MSSYLMASVTVFMLGMTGSSSDANKATLNWVKDYGQAKREAQTAHRPLVVVIENSAEQAGQLDDTRIATTEEDSTTIRDFELCRVDVATDYGRKVADAFGAKQFPYTAISDRDSKRIVFRRAGQMSDSEWQAALAKSMTSPLRTEMAQPYTVQKVMVGENFVDGAVYEVPTQSTPVYDYGTPVYSTPSFPQWLSPSVPADCPTCRLRSGR